MAEDSTAESKIEVHRGFLTAFDSLREQLQLVMEELPEGTTLLLTGHSMGGALAQIAAAYFAHLSPWLVTFAAPAVGNARFSRHLRTFARPFGGVRVWNEYDVVPYLTLLVGYVHAGVPVKIKLKSSAKELFQNESINAIAPALNAIAPHMLFQMGTLVHVFPVLGADDIGAKGDEGFPLSSSAVQLEIQYLEEKKRRRQDVKKGAASVSFQLPTAAAVSTLSQVTGAIQSYAANSTVFRAIPSLLRLDALIRGSNAGLSMSLQDFQMNVTDVGQSIILAVSPDGWRRLPRWWIETLSKSVQDTTSSISRKVPASVTESSKKSVSQNTSIVSALYSDTSQLPAVTTASGESAATSLRPSLSEPPLAPVPVPSPAPKAFTTKKKVLMRPRKSLAPIFQQRVFMVEEFGEDTESDCLNGLLPPSVYYDSFVLGLDAERTSITLKTV